MMTLEDLMNKPQSAWGKTERVQEASSIPRESRIQNRTECDKHTAAKKYTPRNTENGWVLNWRTSYRQNQYLHS